jgi:Domain of Unknown Function (DUF1080)
MMRLFLLMIPVAALAQPLITSAALEQWEPHGDGVWKVTKEKVLIGQRKPVKKDLKEGTPEHRGWYYQQAWIYTKAEYENFDLSLEYWLPTGGNSGIALRDTSRGAAGITNPPNYAKTPSKVAYEIQLNNQYADQHLSGSIYGLAKAPPGLQDDYDWNRLDIRARDGKITVLINGKLAAEHAAPPDRPKRGPIGLQLHDQHSVVMFRNIRVTVR